MKILVVEDHVLMREALKELKGDAAVIVEAPGSKTDPGRPRLGSFEGDR